MDSRLDPEQNRPEGLPTTSAQVHCLRCGRDFEVGAMRWDHRRGLWVCAHWPDCEGAGFHCDLHDSAKSSKAVDGQLISLVEACKLLPRRNGKKVHYATVYRWATKGVRGRVLESQMIGGIRYTSHGALRRYLQPAAGTSPAQPVPGIAPALTPELKAIQRALDDAGL